ncbi:MAG: carboxypeptidase-like regulatory domain-containing protein [Paramuribaculum sp.]|nr:carboxypeptidase-like regulatory domain-containing protein [Paramuribaculum sp.]
MMARGKHTCKILKEIRRQIAEANGIEFATSECRYKGDCLGTCPKCESEVRYLEQQLRARTLAGKAVALAGISAASLAMLMPMSADAQMSADVNSMPTDSIIATSVNSVKIKGVVSDALYSEALMMGVTILNRTNGRGARTNIDGEFEIDACVGDSIEFSYVGYFPKTICVKNTSEPLTILLEENNTQLLGEYEMVSATLDLNVKDEHGKLMEKNKLRISRIRIDDNGEENCEALAPEYLDEKTSCRIYWDYDNALEDEDGKSLKEATLRIEAEGYDDPIIINVKYPKGKAKRTIKFKHKKK